MNEHVVWDEHVRQNGRRLFLLAFRILRDEAAAADACQQALCRAWACRGQLRRAEALGSWLCRAVVNECYGMLRRRRRHVDRMAEIGAEPAPLQAPQHAWEQRQAIAAALAGLPARTRTVVVLRLVHGLSGNEVSSRLEVCASEISRRLHEGMEALRRALAPASVRPKVASHD